MTGGELEFDAGGQPIGWLIPAHRTKNGRSHYVPLPALASEIVTAARKSGGDAAFVFPSPTGEGAIAGHALATAMRRLAVSLNGGKRRAGTTSAAAANWTANPPTAHDLRRTFATRLSAAGVHSDDIAALLNHARGHVTGRHCDQYQRANEKRRALERWAQILGSILEPQSAAGNVVTLRA